MLHVVSAWASENKILLGQVKTNEKSNEITAIPELLDVIDVAGSIVTIDAMGCQQEIAKKVVEKERIMCYPLKKTNLLYIKMFKIFFFEQRKEKKYKKMIHKQKNRKSSRSWTYRNTKIYFNYAS